MGQIKMGGGGGGGGGVSPTSCQFLSVIIFVSFGNLGECN